jgi:ketosteroid isomerase-like protein
MRRSVAAVGVVVLLAAAAALGQQQQSVVPQTEEQKVDNFISEMLAAWQIGDLEMLHKYHAEDVIVVSGAYEPPIIGWTNYAQAYLRQRERVEQVRLERINSALTLRGNIAWVSYQWEFSGMMQGQAASFRGHTTLVLEKRKDKWMVVHNHTSTVGAAEAATPAKPAKPGA